MTELINILKDIKSGALPLWELPGFIAWGIGRMGWFWFTIAVILLLTQR